MQNRLPVDAEREELLVERPDSSASASNSQGSRAQFHSLGRIPSAKSRTSDREHLFATPISINVATRSPSPIPSLGSRVSSMADAETEAKPMDFDLDDESPGANGNGGFSPDDLELGPLGGETSGPGVPRTESYADFTKSIHQAARDGVYEQMLRCLDGIGNAPKKINGHDENKLSPLHYAARYNHLEIVQLLLDRGANPNRRGEDNVTPLHSAVRFKKASKKRAGAETDTDTEADVDDERQTVVIELVRRGADVNSRDLYDLTPLHYAAMRGNDVAVKALLKCKAIEVEANDKQSMTALHMAATHSHVDIVRMLIRANANLRCVDEDNSTPLHLSAAEGNEEVVRLLFRAGEKKDGWVTISAMVTDVDSDKSTPLHVAVENKHYNVVKIILEKGGDVNAHRIAFNTPLHLAAVAGDVQIVKLLLDYRARIDAQNSQQATPLHKAAAYNHTEVAQYLISRGARIEQTDRDSFTPLLTAACYGHSDTIKLLLQRGASIDHADKNEKSAIYWAAEEDNAEALKVLLNYVTKDQPDFAYLVDQPERYNNAPLHIAAEKGCTQIVKILLDYDADLDAKNEEEMTPLHLAAKHGKTSVLREIIRRNKMTVHDEDENSNTPLHLSSLHGHNKAVIVLLDSGADVEARNSVLWTPLDCAAAKGWVKVATALVDNDAPIDPMDKAKTTPLHLASARGHVDMVNFLISGGASMSQRDSDGNNCLDLAIDNNRKDVASAIIKSDKWDLALKNDTRDISSGYRTTPMRKLIKKMPDIAEQVFFRCSTHNTLNPEHPNYSITFNYEFLDDVYANWGAQEQPDNVSVMSGESNLPETYDDEGRLLPNTKPYTKNGQVIKKNSPLFIMVTSKREDLLAHPLVTSLLRHKWNTYGRYVYYVNLTIYLVFLLFLTGYLCSSTLPFRYNSTTLVNSTDRCADRIAQVRNVSGYNKTVYAVFIEVGKYIIMGLVVFFLLREFFQMCHSKLNYIGPENLIEWVMYITALLYVLDFYDCQRESGYREDWQWQCGAVSVFLAWIDLVLFIRKFPRFGIYVVMFTDILYTFLNFFVVFFLFIVAFGLAFYALLANQDPFNNVGESLLKTTVMMIGEFEFDSIFNGDRSNPLQDVHYPVVTYGIFVVFMILMSIIIMNLLVGLAVDDIKTVQEKATLQRMAMQVDLALDVEGVLPQLIKRRFMRQYEKIKPNMAPAGCLAKLFHLKPSLFSSTNIAASLNQELDPIEVVQEQQEKLTNTVKGLKGRVKAIASQNDKIQQMLEALLKHQDVTWEEEDENESENLGDDNNPE